MLVSHAHLGCLLILILGIGRVHWRVHWLVSHAHLGCLLIHILGIGRVHWLVRLVSHAHLVWEGWCLLQILILGIGRAHWLVSPLGWEALWRMLARDAGMCLRARAPCRW